MTDEEAKAEHDAIQAELAKEHGHTDEVETELKPGDEGYVEPEEVKTDEAESDEDEDEEVEEEEELPKKGRSVPISKYQTLKKTSQEKIAEALNKAEAAEAEAAKWKAKVDNSASTEEQDKKIAAYADKHGKTVEEVRELFDLIPTPHVDPEAKAAEARIKLMAKKAEAEEAFETEYAKLVGEVPEAAKARDKIRAAAFKEENLDKSLYEVFHRSIKPETTVIKTGETSRPARRENAGEPDYKKVMEDIKKNVPDAMKGLSDKQLDTLFDLMDKEGSRYSRG